MVFLAYVLVLSDLAVEVIVGAIVGIIIGRAMRGGFGMFGDLALGLLGAIALVFFVNYFGLFNALNYGLSGTIIVSIIGAIVLTSLIHLFTGRKTATVA